MNSSITNTSAIRLYPELQSLVDARQAGWTFRPIINDNRTLVGLSGSCSVRQYTDAIFIYDRTDVAAARVLADEYGGGCVWAKEGADLQEVVYDILSLPEPGAPGAPALVKRSSLLWTLR